MPDPSVKPIKSLFQILLDRFENSIIQIQIYEGKENHSFKYHGELVAKRNALRADIVDMYQRVCAKTITD